MKNKLPKSISLAVAFRAVAFNEMSSNRDELRNYDNADIANDVSHVLTILGVQEPDEMTDDLGRLYEIAHDVYESITGYEVQGEHQ